MADKMTLTEVLETAVEGEEFVKSAGVAYFDRNTLLWRGNNVVVWASRANADGWERVVPEPKPPKFIEWPRKTDCDSVIVFVGPGGVLYRPYEVAAKPGFARFRFPEWVESCREILHWPQAFRVWAKNDHTRWSIWHDEDEGFVEEIVAEAALLLPS